MTDFLGYKAKVGVVVPSTNTTVQPELEEMRTYGVTNHISRMEIQNSEINKECGYDEFVNSINSSIKGAIKRVAPCEPDGIMIAMSPESFWESSSQHNNLKEDLKRISKGIVISMAPDAYLHELEMVSVDDKKPRLGLITPYVEHGSHKSAQFFEDHGFTVSKVYGFGCKDLVRIAHITQSDMNQAIRELNVSSVDAIVQVGSNIPMSRFSVEVSKNIGKPVLANNRISYKHLFREIGMSSLVNEFFL